MLCSITIKIAMPRTPSSCGILRFILFARESGSPPLAVKQPCFIVVELPGIFSNQARQTSGAEYRRERLNNLVSHQISVSRPATPSCDLRHRLERPYPKQADFAPKD